MKSFYTGANEKEYYYMISKQPYKFHMQPGVVYSWCSCGFSATEPLCDGSHRTEAEGKRSVKFQADNEQDVMLCMCKRTKTPPYCDDSHNQSE